MLMLLVLGAGAHASRHAPHLGQRVPRLFRQRVCFADDPLPTPTDETVGASEEGEPSRRGVGQGALLVGTSFYLGGLLGEAGDEEVMNAIRRKRLAPDAPLPMRTPPPTPTTVAPAPGAGAGAMQQATKGATEAVGASSPIGPVVASSALAYVGGLASAKPVLRFGRQLLGQEWAEQEVAKPQAELEEDASVPAAMAMPVPQAASSAPQILETAAASSVAAAPSAAGAAPPSPLPAEVELGRKQRGRLSLVLPVPTKQEVAIGLAAAAVLALLVFTPAGAMLRAAYSRTIGLMLAQLVGALSSSAAAAAAVAGSAVSAGTSATATAAAPAVRVLSNVADQLISAWALLLVSVVSACKRASSSVAALLGPPFSAVGSALSPAWAAAAAASASAAAFVFGVLKVLFYALLAGLADVSVAAIAVRDTTAAALRSAAVAGGAAAEVVGGYLMLGLELGALQLLAVLKAVSASIVAALVTLTQMGAAAGTAAGIAVKSGMLAAMDALHAAGANAPVVSAKASAAAGGAASISAKVSRAAASGAAAFAATTVTVASKLAAASVAALSALLSGCADILGLLIDAGATTTVAGLSALAQMLSALAASISSTLAATTDALRAVLSTSLAGAKQVRSASLSRRVGPSARLPCEWRTHSAGSRACSLDPRTSFLPRTPTLLQLAAVLGKMLAGFSLRPQ